MKRLFPRVFIFVVAVLVLHACGFKLRGAMNLSSDISPIYIEQKTAFELVRDIKSLLAANNIKVVDNAASSRSQLLILGEKKASRVLSVDTGGQAREYLLTYTVDFVISEKSSADVMEQSVVNELSADKPSTDKPDSISISRSLLFDTEAVLGYANESAVLYKDMRRDAARQIILKLQAHSDSAAAAPDREAAEPVVDEIRP